MSTTHVTAEPGTPFIDITREFDAPRELVFRAHTEPDLVRQWLGGSDYEMVIDRWEARDGGAWRYVHRDPAGNEYGFHGVFHGAPTVDRMVQTFEYEGAPGHVSLDAMTLEERDGRTIVRIHTTHQSVESRDATLQAGMAEGMNAGYAKLDGLLEQLRAPVA